jgi:predicted lipid-binding transport protein (Tim44 family)
MMAKPWLKGFLILFALLFLGAGAFQADAWARAGSGRSMGSRGYRSSSPPRTHIAPKPSQPAQPARPAPGVTTPGASQPSSFWRSFGGGLLGGLAGGLLFRSLFGGAAAQAGPGAGGGIGLLDILILAGLAYLVYWYIRKKRQEAALAAEGAYQSSATVEQPRFEAQYSPVVDRVQATAEDQDLEQGLANIRQFDPSFDEAAFQEWCIDVFFKIQAGWANRDMSSARNLLTEELYQLLQQDADRLKAEKKINRLENIAVRSVDLTEAWQESGADYLTVRMYASLLDYNVDESTGQVLDGSKTDPVKFEEYWTFSRPVGDNPWQLSAIQQPA